MNAEEDFKIKGLYGDVGRAFSLICMVVLLLMALCCCIPSVTAETLTGQISGGEEITEDFSFSSSMTSYTMGGIYCYYIEDSITTSTLVWFDTIPCAYTSTAPHGVANIPFSLKSGSNVIVTGTMGYQRLFNAKGTEIAGYHYLIFNDDWNTHGLTGSQLLTIYCPDLSTYFIAFRGEQRSIVDIQSSLTTGTTLFAASSSYMMAGEYIRVYNSGVTATYTATKPSGLKISGNIAKDGYNLKAFVYDGATGKLLTSDSVTSTTALDFNVYADTIIFGITNVAGAHFNSSVLFKRQAGYYVTYTPSSPIPNQTITQELYANSGYSTNDLQTIIIGSEYVSGGSTVHKYMKPTNGYSDQIIEYQKLDNGTWQHWVDNIGFEGNDGFTAPSEFSYTLPVSGEWNILTTVIDDSGTQFDINTSITVSGNVGDKVFGIYPVDTITGNFVTGQIISLKDMQTGKWTNVTSDTVTACNFAVSTGNYVWVVTGTGAYAGHIYSGNDYIDSNYAENVPMQRNDLISSTNGTVIIYVVNTNMAPLSGATIALSPMGISAVTGSSGTVTFYPPFNTTETYSISANGYQSISGSFEVTPDDTPLYLQKMLTSQSIITYVTTAPVTTATPSPTATLKNGTACQRYTANMTLIDAAKNDFACMGVQSEDGQNALIGLCIVLGCGMVAAIKGKGIGFVAGAIVGFVIALYLGLLPIWILIAFCVIAALIFAVHIFGQGGN